MNEILTLLNAATPAERLANLRRLDTPFPPMEDHINNHIHTTFSFSPYSPTAAAWRARAEGLCTAGIIDHDSLGGNREFLEACRVLGLGGTNGVECRVSLAGTPFESVRVNNPDQPGNAYILLHAVPHGRIEEVDDFFAPRREKRNDRNRAMIAKLNALLAGSGVSLDFDRDVLPISQYANRGTVTERHLSSALALKLGHVFGSGERLVAFLRGLDKPVTGGAAFRSGKPALPLRSHRLDQGGADPRVLYPRDGRMRAGGRRDRAGRPRGRNCGLLLSRRRRRERDGR